MGSWDDRHELELEPRRDEDVPETWPDDTHWHLVLLADLDHSELVSNLESIATDIGQFDCLAPVSAEYLHVTVKVIGNVVDTPTEDSELTPSTQKELVGAASDVFSDVDAFEISFPNLDLWPTVVYAAVDDGGRFAELNELACDLPGTTEHWRDRDGFVPHATLGEFRSASQYDDLVACLETNRALDVPSVTVDAIDLVAVEAGGRFPDWRTVERFELD